MESPLSPDTERAAEKAQIDVYRRMPAWRKLQLVEDANRTSRLLSMTGLRRRFSEASDEELGDQLLFLLLEHNLARRVLGARRRRR